MTIPDVKNPTYRLAYWASTLPHRRTSTVRYKAVEGFRDLLLCAIAGAAESTPQNAAQVAKSMGSGRCTMIGHPASDKVSAPWAAFANGISAHYLDFDDSFEPLQGHVSVTILPALLALAEDQGLSGADLLDAYVVGIDASAYIGRPNASVYMRGWHTTAVIGVIATAVACARLLRLSTEQIQSAISIAVSSASGHLGQNGYEVKCMQTAFAARDGLVAALLAKSGVVGNPEALVGPLGFAGLFGSQPDDSGKGYTLPGPDDDLAIVNPGIIFKPYATCGSTHRAIDVCLDFIRQHDITPEDVKSVETQLPFSCYRNLPYDRPANGTQGRFSVHYGISLAFVKRRIVLADFEGDAVKRPEIQEFLPKVTMRAVPGSENNPGTYLDVPVTTTITLHSGKVYSETRYERKGDRRRPLSEEDWRIKSDDCLGRVFEPAKAKAVLRGIDAIGELAQVGELMALLTKGT